MFEPINLAAYADPLLDKLASGEPQLDHTILLDACRQAQGPILELGCGYGRITIPLAQRGIADLTGLDLSAPSLAYARTQAKDLPIHWVHADVRHFCLDRRFALIFARGCILNFMLTRLDQEALLARVREHLAEGGRFLVDTTELAPSQMLDIPEPIEWFTMDHPNGRRIYVSGTERFEHARQLWIQTCYERWDSHEGEWVRPPWELTLRYTMPQEMEALLHDHGFGIVAQYAEYDGTPGTAENPASIYLCEKR